MITNLPMDVSLQLHIVDENAIEVRVLLSLETL